MKLEEKLVSLRKAKGLSQMKLAEKMNRLPTVAVAGSCNKISKNEEWETYYPHYLAVRNNIRVAMEIL